MSRKATGSRVVAWILACLLSGLPVSIHAQSNGGPDGGVADASVGDNRPARPPVTKGDLGLEVGGGVSGLLAGPIVGGAAGGLVVWVGDAVVEPTNFSVGFPEAEGAAIGAAAGMLAGVPVGVYMGGQASRGVGKPGATFLGSLTGLLVGGSLWGVTAIGSRQPSLGFGIPMVAFGLISGGVIGYRTSAPSARPSDEKAARIFPLVSPAGESGGWAGIQVRF